MAESSKEGNSLKRAVLLMKVTNCLNGWETCALILKAEVPKLFWPKYHAVWIQLFQAMNLVKLLKISIINLKLKVANEF